MQKKNLITLLAICLALVVFAMLALNQQTKTVTNEDAGTVLYPTLNKAVNNISQITSQRGNQKVSIKKQDNEWVVVEKDNYPANLSKIKQTILKIAEFAVVEAKTKKSENHKKLKLDDPTTASAKGTLITLSDQNGVAVAEVILGKVIDSGFSANSKAKMYVRKNGDDQVWLVTGELHADPEPIDWLVEDILDIDSQGVKQVKISHPDKKVVVIKRERADTQKFILTDIPKGKQMQSDSIANNVAKALEGLRLLDVKKADGLAENKDAVIETEFQTSDGMVLTAQLTEQDKETFVMFSAKFDPATRDEPKVEVPAEPKADAAPADPHAAPVAKPQTMKDATAVQQQVAELNEKLANWAFKLPANKVDLLKKTMTDLTKDAE